MRLNTSLMRSKKPYVKIIGFILISFVFNCQPKSSSSSHSLPVIKDSINLLYGIIGDTGTILNKKYFIINHNNEWKIPYWVAYKLDSIDLKGEIRRQGRFRPDPDLPVGYRAELKDYESSGYDRGHMAPAADFKRSKEALTTTFLLSNMCPQTSELNRKIWQKLESEVRKRVKTDGKAWIITGNIFMSPDSNFINPNEFIGINNVAVPTHCFKVILSCRSDSIFTMYAFLIPNQNTPILGKTCNYLLSVDRLEKITGYDFFPLLDDSIEFQLERNTPTNWGQ